MEPCLELEEPGGPGPPRPPTLHQTLKSGASWDVCPSRPASRVERSSGDSVSPPAQPVGPWRGLRGEQLCRRLGRPAPAVSALRLLGGHGSESLPPATPAEVVACRDPGQVSAESGGPGGGSGSCPPASRGPGRRGEEGPHGGTATTIRFGPPAASACQFCQRACIRPRDPTQVTGPATHTGNRPRDPTQVTGPATHTGIRPRDPTQVSGPATHTGIRPRDPTQRPRAHLGPHKPTGSSSSQSSTELATKQHRKQGPRWGGAALHPGPASALLPLEDPGDRPREVTLLAVTRAQTEPDSAVERDPPPRPAASPLPLDVSLLPTPPRPPELAVPSLLRVGLDPGLPRHKARLGDTVLPGGASCGLARSSGGPGARHPRPRWVQAGWGRGLSE
ncbi:proline-rich protein 36-like [Dipodomys merriami]|uniref:proline-rich protein 36-like n=1 Tax=Dipodomys merriami TaxID=94247 RepID=UPI003855C58A